MAYVEGTFTHGGNGFLKQILEQSLSNGWTLQEDISNRPGEFASAVIVQNNTDAISIPISGIPVNTDIQLPVCLIGTGFTARANFASTVTAGVDYSINRARGTFRILAGGVFENPGMLGFGRPAYSFTIDAGYNLLNGWFTLWSNGISSNENIYVSLRFDKIPTSIPENPIKCGIRWTSFASWTNGVTVQNNQNLLVRNNLVDDVLQYLHPTFSGSYQASINKDRILCYGGQSCISGWCFAGSLTRFRPASEQVRTSCIAGSTASIDTDDGGIVGDTNQPGAMSQQMGAMFLYDKGQYSVITVWPVELNCNYWTNEVGSQSAGFTPSRLLLSPLAPGGTPQYYFELHDVVCGRNITLLNSQESVLYGLYEGLKAVLVYNARHNLQLTWNSRTFRLWQVGSNPNRHIAVETI